MKLASSILALLCAAALAPAQSPDSSRVRFAISFARNSAPVSETLEAAADVYRKRLGKHAAEAKIISKPEKSQLSIELPFRSAFDALPARKLAKDVSEVATMLELDGDSVLPPGGLVSLGSEWLVFTKSEGATLAELKRGHWGTKAAAHPAGASLELFGLDRMGMLLQARGELVFLQAASEKYLQAKGTSSDEELVVEDDCEAAPHDALRPRGKLRNAFLPELERDRRIPDLIRRLAVLGDVRLRESAM